jgi:chromate transporter
VVGVLLAALYSPVISEGVRSPGDVAVALGVLGLLQFWKIPPIAAVLLCAAMGQWVSLSSVRT